MGMVHRIIWNSIVVATFTVFNFFLAWAVIDSQKFMVDIHPYYYYLVVTGWLVYMLSFVGRFLQEE